MTSIGCDCIILVIINGYVHLGSEGGQYVGHERAAKLVPSAPRGCLLLLQRPVLELAMRRSCVSRKVFDRFYPPVEGRMGGLKRHRPAVPCIPPVNDAQEKAKILTTW